ncbi:MULTISPECIES: hypothetical protein [unclassified Ruegeria]|uniref:hypothetical protein n=1 Tax=unclassified Ruegeria TaxID=2625375 RepID=UPI001AE89619|nr:MULTISPECIES: hypothetical protein [unclassified Ruegeria]
MSEDIKEFFGSIDFRGIRFERANLPVSMLDNIKAYQELLLDLAEEIWREKNPERKRLPSNFRKNLSLSFSHIEDGSAVAVLKRDESISPGLLPDEFSLNYMALAQSRFLETARAANENRKIEGVPAKARNSLKALLADLRSDERLEFVSKTGRDTKHPRVRFSEKTRDRILDSAVDNRVKNIDSIGIVRSILDGSEEIEVLSEVGKFKYFVGRQELRANKYPIAGFCEFSIKAVLQANGLIKSVESQHGIRVLDPGVEYDRIRGKIEEFRSFPEGWKNGSGQSLSDAALTFASDVGGFICGIYQQISIFPQVDGSITLEFSKGDWDIEVNCREKYIEIEVFDDEMDTLNSQVFFGLSPKLLSALSDIDGFVS